MPRSAMYSAKWLSFLPTPGGWDCLFRFWLFKLVLHSVRVSLNDTSNELAKRHMHAGFGFYFLTVPFHAVSNALSQRCERSSQCNTPHALHSNVHNSGSPPNRCVLRTSCIGRIQLGHRGCGDAESLARSALMIRPRFRESASAAFNGLQIHDGILDERQVPALSGSNRGRNLSATWLRD